MPSTLMTPGVYIDEVNAFANSVVAVDTAVPVFIGYTEKAERLGKSLLGKPTSISSFAEYTNMFGGAFNTRFIIDAPAAGEEPFNLNGTLSVIRAKPKNTAYMYDSMRLFFANGGGRCYILSVGTYAGADEVNVDAADFIGSDTKPSALDILLKEMEPTMIVIPDAVSLGDTCYSIYNMVLQHCQQTKSRVGIFDLLYQGPTEQTEDVVTKFRESVTAEGLNYGAAYYPWLKTAIVQPSEVTFTSLDTSVDLNAILPEAAAKTLVENYAANKAPTDNDMKNYHQGLLATSPTYASIMDEVRRSLNELPPSGAMAGIYSMVDATRGVWKAPANVGVNMVNAPSVNISDEQQQTLNVHALTGKSINVIRAFPGIGTLVWGARTLDGNSQDWRYVNVRRTLIMIEQSIKLAARSYVFEPNDATTWVTVKSMIVNFLTNLWKQGALAGAVPAQAFDVQVGLGVTMTGDDILNGVMNIIVKVAVVRPAEFIVITFQQKMQES